MSFEEEEVKEINIQCEKEGFFPVDYSVSRQRQVFNKYFQQVYDIKWNKIGELKKSKKITEIELFMNGQVMKNGMQKLKDKENKVTMRITFDLQYIHQVCPEFRQMIVEYKNEVLQQEVKEMEISIEDELDNNNKISDDSQEELTGDYIKEKEKLLHSTKEETLKEEDNENVLKEEDNENNTIENEQSEENDTIERRKERTLSVIQYKRLRAINYIRIEKLFEEPFLPMHQSFFVFEFCVYAIQFGQWETTRIFQSYKSINVENLEKPLDSFKPFGHLVVKLQNKSEMGLFFYDEIYGEMIEINQNNCNHIFCSKREKFIDVYISFKGSIPFLRKTSPMHLTHDQMRIENYFQHTILPCWESFESSRLQVICISLHPSSWKNIHEVIRQCSISQSDLKISNEQSFSKLLKMKEYIIPKSFEFGWEWMIEKLLQENIIVPNQITQEFIDEINKYSFNEYNLHFRFLLNTIETNKYHRAFDIMKLIPSKKDSSIDFTKKIFCVQITPSSITFLPPKIRSYSGEIYLKNICFSKLCEGNGNFILIQFNKEDAMTNEYLMTVMNNVVTKPFKMIFSNSTYDLYCFLLTTNCVIYIKKGITINISRKDMAFSCINDQNQMWLFKQIVELCKIDMKDSHEQKDGVNRVNDYWKHVQSLYELYGRGEYIDQISLDTYRYLKLINIYNKYKNRLDCDWKVDYILPRQKWEFFRDFSDSTLRKLSLKGEMKPSLSLQKIMIAFGIDPNTVNCLIKPRIDIVDLITYDIYNLIRYINLNHLKNIHLIYYPPVNH
ncbi:hypothetical protein ENUP19_0050G0050 [Entamoeba nuttalli]|uniref:Uncharacterized protein n=2 Tax=Entamoeba nuttalli TaxID=412467 RepID=K2H618_ENTNP|nr:hypothetical protein ENU1_040650 [Entamoeba nuttalli P19]EKE41897.1 hypothetical protein ENU1_040650 [Entamoeba nuttalli P19]|eukprot:XP_008855761.1 hypothetical protein ENU1_040650 [Entamoeba nuttalli P19]